MAASTVVRKCEADRLQAGLLPSLTGHKLRRCRARGSPGRKLSSGKGRGFREIIDVVIRNVGRKVCLAAGSGMSGRRRPPFKPES